jgi:hypothetical protein
MNAGRGASESRSKDKFASVELEKDISRMLTVRSMVSISLKENVRLFGMNLEVS